MEATPIPTATPCEQTYQDILHEAVSALAMTAGWIGGTQSDCNLERNGAMLVLYKAIDRIEDAQKKMDALLKAQSQ